MKQVPGMAFLLVLTYVNYNVINDLLDSLFVNWTRIKLVAPTALSWEKDSAMDVLVSVVVILAFFWFLFFITMTIKTDSCREFRYIWMVVVLPRGEYHVVENVFEEEGFVVVVSESQERKLVFQPPGKKLKKGDGIYKQGNDILINRHKIDTYA